MSRQISRRYLLFCLSVGAILTSGSSRRIPRGASCPSCSQDCPEALTVQLPWNPRQESNLRDFSTNLLQNSPYSRLMRGRISQDIACDDNVPLNQNSMSFGNYREFISQEPRSKNLFFKNYFDNSPRFLDTQEIFSQDKPAKEYPRVVPSRQVFDRSENLFFRNPRNKHSESLSEDYERTKDSKEVEENPMGKVLAVYPVDRDTKPSWKNSRDTSSTNDMQSEKIFANVENIYRLPREDILNEERNTIIKKSLNSAIQLRHPRERYNSIRFGPSEVKREPYVKDMDIPKSTTDFFDNWDIAEDSSHFLNPGQFRNHLSEVQPVKKQEISVDDDEQINFNSHNSKFLQDLNIWKSKNDEELYDSLMRANTESFENKEDMNEDMKEYFEDETKHFMDDKDVEDYFADEPEQDSIETKRNNYNPLHVPPQNIWKGIESDELLDDLDFMYENSQETGLYSEENNKFFQDEQNEDVIIRDKTYTNAETARSPMINAYNAYILPRYLNIVNDKMSETQELLKIKNSIHANPVNEMDHKFFEDEDIIEDNKHIQSLIRPKNIFDVEEMTYSQSIVDKLNDLRNKNKDLTELDPDLVDDIENPPIETTEPTPT